MKDTKTTSRAGLLNLMLLKAWRERWSDAKWGINIKTVLPRGVSGDVYNLADCILQQAVIGSNANLLAISYLKHSLCAHLISHAAVLKRISKFEDFDKVYCLTALLDLLNSIMDGVTCRGKPEENVLPAAVVSLVLWLIKILAAVLKVNDSNKELQAEEQNVFNKTIEVIDKIIKNDFLIGILYIGKQEELDLYQEIMNKSLEINMLLKNSKFTQSNKQIEIYINQLANLDVEQLDMKKLNSKTTETITFCVQPMFAVALIVNPTSDTNLYVSQMLMVQRLKGFTCSRLFYEIMRSGFISLNTPDVTHDVMWSAITFMKMPHIIKQIYAKKEMNYTSNYDHIPDVIEALDMILDDSFMFDYIDAKCEKNFVEFLLKEWVKQRIVNEEHVKIFAGKREPISPLSINVQVQSVIKFITCAEVPLSGILKTLKIDYNKAQIQESLQQVLCQILIGNTFDLILQVATVEGLLKTFISRLIKCNEHCKYIPNETDKSALTHSILFDVSFLMLTYIVQNYGSDIVLSDNADSFFARWVKECMVEHNRMKYPKNMVALCDETIVDELLLTLKKPDGQLKNWFVNNFFLHCILIKFFYFTLTKYSNASWHEICMNIPGVLYQVLVAWENETLSTTDVKRILEYIKIRPFSYSVCAASYLCAYMQTVKEDEFLKPHNMIHLLISTPSAEDMPTPHQEHIKERFSLTNNIIRKMLNDVQPTTNSKIRNSMSQQIVSHPPLEEQFREVWKGFMEAGWLPIKLGQILESLLNTCGPTWLVNRLVEEILKCKYTREMYKTMDMVFAIMHLDIEGTTTALLQSVVPTFLVDKQVEPQSSVLARLCVYCIISCLETPILSTTKKRQRNDEMDIDNENFGSVKSRKLNADDSCSNDFIAEHFSNSNSSNISNMTNRDNQNVILKESLQISLQALFKMFANFVTSNELSPRIYFVFQFITLLVECGKDRVKPILKLLPNNLIQNLLKVMATDEIRVGLICRLYDLRATPGRVSAVSDLCLLRNIRMRKQSINL
ncbi:mediator of RNA polymerase II transcription subunit 24 [Condylostylus longicornis]|uniref:mediator of RNA polymerase II transcription subunit 24 n=1 Tax=Condylostylus longicornis TaxID=2530218 RepID=UPI00244DA05E|nr:mediator of RNA polymerase II transcription subunit 24 [Condylostylus longicornis]